MSTVCSVFSSHMCVCVCVPQRQMYCSAEKKPVTGPSSMLYCLLDKLGEQGKQFDSVCRHILRQAKQVVFSDYRLVQGVLEDCSDDINKLECHHVEPIKKVIHLIQACILGYCLVVGMLLLFQHSVICSFCIAFSSQYFLHFPNFPSFPVFVWLLSLKVLAQATGLRQNCLSLQEECFSSSFFCTLSLILLLVLQKSELSCQQSSLFAHSSFVLLCCAMTG